MPVTARATGSSCTVSALNRNAPVAADATFEIYNIPGSSGAFRARATCSDGTVGQTAVVLPVIGDRKPSMSTPWPNIQRCRACMAACIIGTIMRMP